MLPRIKRLCIGIDGDDPRRSTTTVRCGMLWMKADFLGIWSAVTQWAWEVSFRLFEDRIGKLVKCEMYIRLDNFCLVEFRLVNFLSLFDKKKLFNDVSKF
jgi:hypothetical protein